MCQHVIIIGAAKSGSSSLFQHLSTHERVNTSAGKEPHFFCDGFYEQYQEEGTAYRDLWDEEQGDILIEATTGYTKHPVITGAPKNMVDSGISPQIIYIVREPISRLRSHVKYMTWRDESIDVDELREVSVVSSMYCSQIQRYIDTFGIESVKLVLLDDLASDPDSCIKDIFRFIGVDPVSIKEDRRENQTREVTNLELMLRSTPIWNLKSLFSETLKSRIRSFWSTFSESPEADVLAGIDEERLQAMCEDALRLEELFDVDLTPWREAMVRSPLLPETKSSDV